MRLTSTRNAALSVSFMEGVLRSLPAEREGGGLFVPAELVPWADADSLLDLPWLPRCVEILDRLRTNRLLLGLCAALAACGIATGIGVALDLNAKPGAQVNNRRVRYQVTFPL